MSMHVVLLYSFEELHGPPGMGGYVLFNSSPPGGHMVHFLFPFFLFYFPLDLLLNNLVHISDKLGTCHSTVAQEGR